MRSTLLPSRVATRPWAFRMDMRASRHPTFVRRAVTVAWYSSGRMMFRPLTSEMDLRTVLMSASTTSMVTRLPPVPRHSVGKPSCGWLQGSLTRTPWTAEL